MLATAPLHCGRPSRAPARAWAAALFAALFIALAWALAAVADLSLGGHGALLSPLPRDAPARIQRLLDDPPGFERTRLAELHARTRLFFDRHLLN